jgi:SET domain-containing protein
MHLIIRKSEIEGRGVFAGKDIQKGEIVIRWNCKELTSEEAKILPETEKKYLTFVDKKYYLMLPPARYVNHSCNPNTFVKDFCDVAKRNIQNGEEITTDYSATMDTTESMNCKCNSHNCRKIIRASITQF